MYGEARLYDVIAQHRASGPREIEERVYASVTRFADGAPQTDDLTMVVVKMAPDGRTADANRGPDSPLQARGGPSAARGLPHAGGLRGPAEAETRAGVGPAQASL